MNMKVLCCVIHGIGPQDQHYSDPLQQGVQHELNEIVLKKNKQVGDSSWGECRAADLVEFTPFYWANIGSDEQDQLYRMLYPNLFSSSPWWKRIYQGFRDYRDGRELAIRLIGDILGYLGKYQEPISEIIAKQLIEKLEQKLDSDEKFSLILVSHSLGSVILHDIVDRLIRIKYLGLDQALGSISVITMGSPIALFSLAHGKLDPGTFHSWTNFMHRRDLIAYPLSPIYKNAVKDISIKKMIWNPLTCHANYWKDKDVHSQIAKKIVEHFEKKLFWKKLSSFPAPIPRDVFFPRHPAADQAGFSDYINGFDAIPFEELIRNAKEIDICYVYGGRAVKAIAPHLKFALRSMKCTARVCMISEDSPAISGVLKQFGGMSREMLKARIDEGVKELLDSLKDATQHTDSPGRLVIYSSQNPINYSFYRIDDVMYFVQRQLTSDKAATTPLPVFVFRSTGDSNDFFSWVMKDFALLLNVDGDANLLSDSRPSQSKTS